MATTDTEWVTACNNAACLQVKQLTCDVVAIRDSEGGPTVTVARESWEAFLTGAKNGAFDEVTG